MLALLAPLLSAGVMTVGGVPVAVESASRFGRFYRLSVPAAAGAPAMLQTVLLKAAAQRTLSDGRLAFLTSGEAFLAPAMEARIEQAHRSVRRSADGKSYTLAFQEVAADGALRDQAINAAQALQVLSKG